MCEALDLKVNFVPLPGATALPRTPHKCRSNDYCPCCRIILLWKICQALDLPATYDPNINRTTIFRRRNKTTPVVHSTSGQISIIMDKKTCKICLLFSLPLENLQRDLLEQINTYAFMPLHRGKTFFPISGVNSIYIY
ncbi:hypothetical protein TNIN_73101 [Trichonephila inaurata madagascariensis]|uniref:Uncharacterized protein n=1 Tax=Trichonephila inaurata madagascariensis TaxID=2747483 RepID=A0A8X6YAN4_9ARAC|nr:hypothetical protein TNIN_73101 [Trichonephila inaurata madagascariensis]